MEEMIEHIKESAISTAAYLELPTEDELVLVEEEILLPIPKALKIFLLEVSDLICGRLEPVTVADPGAHTHLSEVTSNAWAIGMPRDLMAVCQDGDNYYCINQEGEVLYWQDGEIHEQGWEDIWQWADTVWLES